MIATGIPSRARSIQTLSRAGAGDQGSGSSATESRRGRHRRLVMGLATLLGGRPRGFFIPHRYADRVTPCAYPALETTFAASWSAFERVLAAIDDLAPELRRLGGPAPAPRFDQDWFPPARRGGRLRPGRNPRPRRIVEVGSGHSTRFLARAIADHGLATDAALHRPGAARDARGSRLYAGSSARCNRRPRAASGPCRAATCCSSIPATS